MSHNKAALIFLFAPLILKDKGRGVHCPEESTLMEMQRDAFSAGRCHSLGPFVFVFPGTRCDRFMEKSNFVVISL